MSLSIRPGDSVPTRRIKRLSSAIQLGIIACTLVGMVWGGAQDMVTLFGGVLTKKELEAGLASHNTAIEAHPGLRAVDAGQSELIHQLKQELEAERKATVALGAQYVGLVAAQREPRAASRDAASAYYVRKYDLLTQRGVPVGAAIIEALDTPWPHRPR